MKNLISEKREFQYLAFVRKKVNIKPSVEKHVPESFIDFIDNDKFVLNKYLNNFKLYLKKKGLVNLYMFT